MSLGVNTNVNAAISILALQQNELDMSRAMQRLSTGKRINSAQDDAAGLAVASRMSAQINGLNQAIQNAQQAVSMVEVAEGATVEISSMLLRMRELAVASQNGTNTTNDRNAMVTEFQQLQTEMERIADNTQYNGQNILDHEISQQTVLTSAVITADDDIHITAHGYTDGQKITYQANGGTALAGLTDGTTYFVKRTDADSFQLAATSGGTAITLTGTGNDDQYFSSDVVSFQVGANASQTITVAFGEFETDQTTGVFSGAIDSSTIGVSTAASAAAAMAVIDTAISGVDSQRAGFGSALNRLNMAIANLSNAKLNAEASRSRVLDTDYAAETAELARTQIIAQAGIAMLSQANAQPQNVLALLQA
jgi:flagellin